MVVGLILLISPFCENYVLIPAHVRISKDINQKLTKSRCNLIHHAVQFQSNEVV